MSTQVKERPPDKICTAMSDKACPVHGSCTCPKPDCSLHGFASDHPRISEGYLGGLILRLRGVYVLPVDDGAGLLDGKDTVTSTFDVPPISREAARAIEQLRDYEEGHKP